MTKPFPFRPAPVAVLLTVALALAGCAPGTAETPAAIDPTAPVTISVGDKPTSEKPEELKSFERRLAQFGTEHSNITVEAEETKWEADTFQALLAGGQLPTVFSVPFTEIQGLIDRQQVADVTDFAAAKESLSNINPSVTEVVKNDAGRMFGIPVNAYTMGLLYNRALFTKAGLDPDNPPATWADVRTAAAAIEGKTDAQGFSSMTLDNTGGWVLTTMSYAFGGAVESADGKTATVTNDATRSALEFYQQLRWQDDSFGDNFLQNYDDASNAFAGAKVGMFVQGADAYSMMVINKGMAAEDFGVAPLPQAENALGTLGGGSVMIINPTSTPEQIAAAMEWIDFRYFDKFTDEAVAKSDAKAAAADGLAVGSPGLPILNQKVNDRYLGWIQEHINVPRQNYRAYLETVETIPLVPEPPVKAQELYATLDPVVQAVLTRQDADLDALLAAANKTVQAAIDAG